MILFWLALGVLAPADAPSPPEPVAVQLGGHFAPQIRHKGKNRQEQFAEETAELRKALVTALAPEVPLAVKEEIKAEIEYKFHVQPDYSAFFAAVEDLKIQLDAQIMTIKRKRIKRNNDIMVMA